MAARNLIAPILRFDWKPMRILALPGPTVSMRTMNPYCYLLYSNMEAEVTEFSGRFIFGKRHDVFHLHWPEANINALETGKALIRLLKTLLIVYCLRLRGTKVVWTVHNLKSHDQKHPRLEAWFWKVFTRQLNAFIALSEAGLKAVQQRYPDLQNIPGYVIPHGHYRGEYVNGKAANVRELLGIGADAKVILFFGQVRPYKNVGILIKAVADMQDASVLLYVVGRCSSKEYQAELEKLAENSPNVRFVPHHIKPEDVQLYMNAADLVALPYRDILNSGSALLALSFDRPILVPALGAMNELAANVGDDWVRVFGGEISARLLDDSLRWAVFSERASVAPLNDFEWKRLAALTLSAFQEVCRS